MAPCPVLCQLGERQRVPHCIGNLGEVEGEGEVEVEAEAEAEAEAE